MLGGTLKNKKIIISAGASGIGWAITKVCVAKGASVYLCDIDPKAINKVKKNPSYNKRIFVSETDASDETEVIDFFHKIKKISSFLPIKSLYCLSLSAARTF